MAHFLVYWRDFWNDPGDPARVDPNWASDSSVLFQKANAGDVFWVVIAAPEGRRDEWALLERVVVTGKMERRTKYGNYYSWRPRAVSRLPSCRPA